MHAPAGCASRPSIPVVEDGRVAKDYFLRSSGGGGDPAGLSAHGLVWPGLPLSQPAMHEMRRRATIMASLFLALLFLAICLCH